MPGPCSDLETWGNRADIDVTVGLLWGNRLSRQRGAIAASTFVAGSWQERRIEQNLAGSACSRRIRLRAAVIRL